MKNSTTNISNKLSKIYYSPQGYWKGFSAITHLANAAKVSKAKAQDWLSKQDIWQIYLPAPKYIPRPKFDVSTPNEVHQADLLFLPKDGQYKYALTVVDIGSRYKASEPLKTKNSTEVADAFAKMYKKGPLKWPTLLQVDPGKEFMGEVTKLMKKNSTKIRRGRVEIHRDQGIVERFNRTLAERLFGYQYHQELLNPEKRSTEWVKRLPSVMKSLNNERTRLTGLKPSVAIKRKAVKIEQSKPRKDEEEILPFGSKVRYLYEDGELEGGRRRATDPIWSIDTYNINRYRNSNPVVYYLQDGPERGFVREELMTVP